MVREEMMLTFKERIKERPWSVSWEYPAEYGGGQGLIAEKGNIDYEGLNDHEKFCLYVFAWNLSEQNPFRRTVMKNFEWSLYKTKKLAKALIEIGAIESSPLISERTGMLCGRGYWYTGKLKTTV
jgi:hypothetical protein